MSCQLSIDYTQPYEVDVDPREWIAILSVWGGSVCSREVEWVKGYRLGYEGLKTLSAAKAEAREWCLRADTVGADASLFNVRTREHRLHWD